MYANPEPYASNANAMTLVQLILNVVGLIMIGLAVFHFLGWWGLLGYEGVILRYEGSRLK